MDTDKEWEKWGSLEPYFGVITSPDFLRRNLDKEAKERFFASGRDHAEHVLRVCRERVDPSFRPQRALDFGCGVGRVALALAGLVETVIATDVSQSMLREAEENRVQRSIQNVAFSLSDDSLTTIQGTFDLIHSYIVFQHLEIARARGIFAALIDRLNPGGIFVAHFTYAKTIYSESFGRPPADRNPRQGIDPDMSLETLDKPAMLMNSFDMNELLFLMQRQGVKSFFTEFTDHGGELGVLLYFQRCTSGKPRTVKDHAKAGGSVSTDKTGDGRSAKEVVARAPAPTSQGNVDGGTFHSKVLDALACPLTGGPIRVLPLVTADGCTKEGLLLSPTLDQLVGKIRNFQFDFVHFEPSADVERIKALVKQGDLPRRQEVDFMYETFPPQSDLFQYAGDWRQIEDEMLVTDSNEGRAAITFTIKRDATVLLASHPWSGIVQIYVDGHEKTMLDLYAPHTTIPTDIHLSVPEGKVQEVRIVVTGKRSAESMGRQCLFRGCRIKTERLAPLRYAKQVGIRGAEFARRFWELIDHVPHDGLALDIGGGRRQIADGRYVNLDYAKYPEPDVIGDALHLPFKNESIDFVYSTGVFEHLRNPIMAGDEIFRVTRRGGKILIGIAFMQPIHSEGQHFFNATVWGIEEIFKRFTIDKVLWEGSMHYLVDWVFKCAQLDGHVGKDDLNLVLQKVREWDTHVSYDRLKYFANGVWLEGTKA